MSLDLSIDPVNELLDKDGVQDPLAERPEAIADIAGVEPGADSDETARPLAEPEPEPASLNWRCKALHVELKRGLKAADAAFCSLTCQRLIDLFNQTEEPGKLPVFSYLFGAIVLIKQKFKNFSHQPKRLLTECMMQLSKTILLNPWIKIEDQFLANYNYYWCAKNHPGILRHPTYLAEVKNALNEALSCAELMTPSLIRAGTFRSSRLNSQSFWHRLAQLNLARWSLGLAKPEELPAILENAVLALRRIVNFGVGLSSMAVLHNQITLAGCLDWLGRLHAEKQQWRTSNNYYLESDRWLGAVAQAEPTNQQVRPSAFLAEFYFNQQEFSLAFEYALKAVADDVTNSVEGLHEGSFHYFLEQLLVFRGSDTTDFLLDLIGSELPPISNLIALSALALNSEVRSDWSYAQVAQWFFVVGAEQLQLPEIMEVPSDKRHLLVTSGEVMMDFVRDCEHKITAAEAASQIEILSRLVAATKAMSFDQKEDTVLLSLLAQAQSRIGDYESALPLFSRLLGIDTSKENRSRTLYLLGDLHLARGELERAANVYESSFRIGHHHAALFKAAVARTGAGQFELAIQHLRAMLSEENPNIDEAPHQTRTVLAQAYWGRYCLDEELGGHNPADVEAACEALSDVLTGKIGTRYVHDFEAVSRFVDMIRHPIAVAAIAELLRNSWDAEQVGSFSNALARRHTYPRLIIEVALERLSDLTLWDEVKRGFVRILARALARAYHYGEIDGLSFDELAALIVTHFQQLSPATHQELLCSLLMIEQRASRDELMARYADEAMKVFAPIMGTREEALEALANPDVLTPINDFLLLRMPPATEPVAYGYTDSADLYQLARELVDELTAEFQEPIEEAGSNLSLKGKSGSATVSLMEWLDRIRPFLLNLLDIPRHQYYYSARGPLASLAAEAPPWSIQLEVIGSQIEIVFQFYQIDVASNPTRVLEQAEQRLKSQCELAAVKDLVRPNLQRLESDHWFKVTVSVPGPVEIAREFASMDAFVNYMKKRTLVMLAGNYPTYVSYHRGQTIFAAGFQPVRDAETEKWVQFIRHLLDVRYVISASWLLFLPLAGADTGKHPRSIVHGLKQKVELAILKQEKGMELTREELAELRKAPFRLAANILFTTRDSFHSTPRIWLKGTITQIVNEFSERLPEVQFSVFCSPDAYARIHRQLFLRVMLNLLHNAVTAAVAADTRLVEVRVANDQQSGARISVINTYNPELPRSETGTGIGLEDVRYVIGNLSKGEVRVREDKDNGEFEVLLVLPDDANRQASRESL
jgi:tetratricopeptide (TPR) repeat protein